MTENTEKNPSLQVEHLGKQNHWWHSPNMILGSLLPLLTLVILTGQTIIFWQQKDLMGRQTQILEQQTRIQLNQTSPYISMDVKVLNNQIIAKTKNNNGIARRLGVVSIDCALGSTVFPKQNAYKLLNCIPEDIESIVLNGQEIVISFNENLRKIWDLYKLTDEFGSKKIEFISIIKLKYLDIDQKENQVCFNFLIALNKKLTSNKLMTSYACDEKPIDILTSGEIDINSINLTEFKLKF